MVSAQIEMARARNMSCSLSTLSESLPFEQVRQRIRKGVVRYKWF